MTDIIKTAIISPCHRYRYLLTRRWSSGPLLGFVMLNPSTADASNDDQTIRRCMEFARREGAGGIRVVNLYALRATDPKEVRKAIDPFGPGNADHVALAATAAAATMTPVVCAWGTLGGDAVAGTVWALQNRNARLVCLGKTKDGHPRHPLYVKGTQPLVPFP